MNNSDKTNQDPMNEPEVSFRDLYENAPDMYLSVDPETRRIVQCNQTTVEKTGFEKHEIIGRLVLELYHPDSREAALKAFSEFTTGGEVHDAELQVLCKDGSRLDVSLNVTAIRDKDGRIIQSRSSWRDISRRKQVEAELKLSEEKFRSLYSNMSEGSAIHTLVYDAGEPKDYLILDVNQAFEAQLGISRETVINKTSREAYHVEEPPYFEIYSRVALTGKPESFETYFAPLEKYFSISVYSPQKGSFATIFTDITERKAAEQSLIQSEAKLRELNATKDKFFSIIAHDLRSPFSNILGFTDLLKKEVRQLDIESIVKYTDIINSSAQRTFNLLENLLDWARMQHGGIPFEPVPFLLNSMIKREIAGLKNIADQKGISLVNETKQQLILTADEAMLGSVLRNLVSNALKFTFKDGKVCIEAKKTGDNVEISVSDTGIGMKPDTIKNLFKIETSFSTRGTGNEKGTGLGLLLCKEFVQKHKGSINVESEPGKGSTFRISIPVSS